ncbi:ABC transporter permease [Pullulanibacillus sp. KACC 23026]|uniref:ABC transporter permease n=1 Tax=Pullulanibacillus sp. KACC 23026 TaxID=3028315 RepID=UPI0023AEA835|nr:ABC transporter permease [Pullulanibacillus sp. KACC 23026]WEG11274.1 ABC transporter permease [Pullulanibacillus sp. KACC 23026]
MISLIKNEQIKLFNRRTTKAAFLGIVILNLLIALVIKRLFGSETDNFLVGTASAASFLMILSFVITGFAGAILSTEYELGTIKFLLIRPTSRVELLLAKFLGIQLVNLYFLIAFLLSSMLFSVIFFGFHHLDQNNMHLIIQTVMKYVDEFMDCLMISTLAIAFSTVFKNSAIAVGSVFAITIIGKTVVELLRESQLNWGKYVLFSNTNFSQYLSGEHAVFNGMTPLFSVGMLAGYFIVFMALSLVVFAKSDVTV